MVAMPALIAEAARIYAVDASRALGLADADAGLVVEVVDGDAVGGVEVVGSGLAREAVLGVWGVGVGPAVDEA